MKNVVKSTLAAVAGSLIFVGIPLLAWGPGQTSAFFDDPVRLWYVVLIIPLQLFAVFYVPLDSRGSRTPKEGVARHRIDLLLIQILSLAILFIAPYSDRHMLFAMKAGDALRYAGLALMVLGFILMQIAEKSLGRQFSVEVTIQADHQLVTSGPYRYLRHPRYSGVLLFFLGISIAFGSYLALAGVGLLGCVLAWRIHAEESLLQQEFGAEWDGYCAKSWRVIPFVF